MEVKINREIRNYTEAMFFGLSENHSCVCRGPVVERIVNEREYCYTKKSHWLSECICDRKGGRIMQERRRRKA